jgi:hypothetical protein
MCGMNKALTPKELSPLSCLFNLLLVDRISIHVFFSMQTNLGVSAEST